MWLTFIALLLCSAQLNVAEKTQNQTGRKATAKKDATTTPNFVILFADDLGYGDLAGMFGHPTSFTPNLNKLGERSKVLSNFYVAATVCTPSRGSLMTGTYPVQNGMYPGTFDPHDLGGLPHETDTIAERLYELGYATTHVGKWHLGVGIDREWLPTMHGFERYVGIPYSHDMCPCDFCFPDEGENNSEGHCYSNCKHSFVSCPLIETAMQDSVSSENTPDDSFKIIQQPADLLTLTDKYTQWSIEFMENSINEKKPFFLYLAYQQTHHPVFAGPNFYNTTDRGQFGDALAEMDHSIGKIMEFIEEAGVMENTVIFFSADNGPLIKNEGQETVSELGGAKIASGAGAGSAGLFRCGKGTTWEGGQRVPGLISYPSKIEPGTSHALTTALDVLPTFVSMAGGDVDQNGVGYDLSDLLFNDAENPREVFLYYGSHPSTEEGPYAVRYKNYKAHFYTKGADLSGADNYDLECRGSAELTYHDPPLLFDLFVDPGERWAIGSKSDIFKDIMPKLLAAKEAEEAKIGEWATSAIRQGTDNEAMICCSGAGVTCEPFPECCDCPTKHNKIV